MDVRNCKRCGKVFQYRGHNICYNCITQEEEDFQKVREYIQKHPNSTTVEVSEATEVSIKTITRFLREGRLDCEGFDTSDLGLQCEKCGKEISSGRYCDECINELQSGFKEASKQIETPVVTKVKPREVVHTYDNILGKK
ncbi:MAG TPA: MerR family transcriptional regulator [Bacillota bacterium]|jgi:flagellar operon protein (TIGR03826 family)|nr:MerR family transcriptional regulator [Bacillota bacterium]HOL10350.1 MerR family transcriptional regulator [Bacillota bacterium]HPO97362.1 MerR family transcriptional regulator [Bacillota bacterium]